MEMAQKYREELVGKRFLSVSAVQKLNISKVSEWGWKAGVIRAATHKDNKDKELQVLVEYDGEGWTRRRWIALYESRFHTFLVENILVTADRVMNDVRKRWPALSFEALIPCKMEDKPVEFLIDRQLAFLAESETEAYEDWEADGDCGVAARLWTRRQQAQRVLQRAPAALRGCRVQVYRARGATQWYTAVIVGCNNETGELTVTDDTVLEERNEDPSLVQIRLLGDGVVESIMRGESVGIMPRRSRSGALLAKEVNQVSRVTKRNATKNAKNHRNTRLLATEPPDTEKEEKSQKKKKRVVLESVSENEAASDVAAPLEEPEDVSRSEERGPEKEEAEEAEAATAVAAESGGRDAVRGAAGRDVARMEDGSRFADDRSDRSDSGVSSLRSASGDERSGSRSSALSEEPLPLPLLQALPLPLPLLQALPLPDMAQPPPPPPPLYPPLLRPLPPGIYGAAPDLLWPKRFPDDYGVMERERHDRHLRNRHILRDSYSAADLLAAPAQRLSWNRERRDQEVRDQIENQQLKEREKERERIERDRERDKDKRDREQQERERQEKAVHKHFEESLRLANQKVTRERTISWSLINSLTPQGRGAVVPNEHERAHPADRLRNDARDQRPYYSPSQVQRPPSVPKNDYPPPAHSRISSQQKSLEKAPVHVGLPKAEPNFNMYNYNAYHHPGYLNHDGKHKTEHIGQPQLHNNISASKAPSGHERDNLLPTPPPVNEYKNSVIVKHDGKMPHYPMEAKVHPGHSPKLRGNDIPCRYVNASHSPGIEYRNAPPPMQTAQRGRPHHHSPAPVPSRVTVPMQHAPLPAQQPPDRYGRQPPASYNYHSQGPPPAAPPAVPSKPKVSSPAPPHIYGKPNAGITSGIPVCRAQETVVPVNPIPLTSKVNTANCFNTTRPPPAHHWRGNPRSVLPHRDSPPLASHPAPLPLAYQTQPLDLGVSSERDEADRSPKRRGTPVQNVSDNVVDFKKRRTESLSSPIYRMDTIQQYPVTNNTSPLLSRVSEPTPLIASAATTITTMVNTAAYCTSPAPRTITDSPVRIPSADGAVRPPSVPDVSDKSRESEAISPHSLSTHCPSPLPTATPVTTQVVSPAPSGSPKDGSAPVRHLKKAWLQRHEKAPESEQESPGTGGGSSVLLPLVTRPSDTLSLNNVGSMAVNSIIRNKSMKISRKSTQKEINGHCDDSRKLEDSSSSDQERSSKSPPKRKPPKVKRKKGGGTRKVGLDDIKKKKSAALSESGSDSDKESNSDKDSDSGASLNHSSVVKRTANGGNGNSASAKEPKDKEPRKRGRRPKTSKSDKTDDEPIRSKKSKDDPPGTPFNKPPVSQLKKTGESFLQDGACCDVAPKLAKCRECRWTPHQRSKNMPNIFCRFYAFRRLRYTKNGLLAIAGFSDPNKDPSEEDKKLWLQSCGTKDLDIEMSCFLLRQIGDQFCELLQQEREAKNHNLNEDKTIAWKRVVQGVREMCDVCETTLFNFHWACGKCGFVVCLDCYKSRAQGGRKVWNSGGSAARERDEHGWLTCTSRAPHEQAKLMPTQIAAGDALARVGKRAHVASALWGVPRHCRCPAPPPASPNAMKACRNLLCDAIAGNLKKIKDIHDEVISNGTSDEASKAKNNGTSLSWLADVSVKSEDKRTNDDSTSSDSDGDENYSTLRELLIRPSNKPGSGGDSPTNGTNKSSKKSRLDILDDVISSVNENKDDERENDMDVKSFELKHFVRRYNRPNGSGKDQLPIRIMTLMESKELYPDTPHSWLCDGKLLRLHDPAHPGNYKIFQDQWKRGQPVIVSDVLKHMDKDLWTPEGFARDFGEEKNDLINCITGNIVPNQPMKKFWEGFEHTSRRLKDEHGDPMLLKLKDWPPGEDFSELLPARFSDLMKNLPMQDYTIRSGRLNLASRLPECFVRPDLGPKMYTAYGSALHPGHGTTNLHLDVSDAVNVMVYVGGPKDVGERITREAFRAIDEAGCDILTRRRVRERGEIPGALWHIYSPRDADKIRDLLNKTAIEKGAHPQPHHDPIHDQSCYLDTALRERLYKEYRVEGYAVAQCLGDAVFIPAGAPHQVRNLHDCIKVAEDFVSPENVSHCFHLTQEFRDLSDTHTNHEDKLQIKNIIYHAVKDSLDCLKRAATVAENRGDSDSSKDDIKMET